MTKNLSAVKKDQIALRNNIRNRNYKSAIKTFIKKALSQIDSIELIDTNQKNFLIAQAYSKIDKGVKRGVISKNSAARRKSILSNKFKEQKQSQ